MTPSRGRRLVVFLSGLALAACLALVLVWLPSYLQSSAIRELGAFFGRPVTATVEGRLFPLELEIRDLRVPGASASDPPTLTVPRILVTPSVGWLWEGRIVLSRVRVERPTLRLASSAPNPNAPRPAGPAPLEMAGLRIRRLTVEGGAVILDKEPVPVELDLPEITSHLGARRGGALAGHVSMGPGTARFGSAPPLPVEASLDVVLTTGRLLIEGGRVRSTKTDVSVAGEIEFPPHLRGKLKTEGQVDLAELDQHVLQTGFALTGTTQYAGEIVLDGASVSFRGRLEGRSGSWKGAPVPAFSGNVSWDRQGLEVDRLALETLGGSADLDIQVPKSAAVKVRGHLDHIDVDGTLVRLFDMGAAGVGAAASGDVRLSWPRGKFRDGVSGEVKLALAPSPGAGTSVEGVVDWTAENGVQTLRNVAVRTADTEVTLSGSIGRDGRTDISVLAHSTNLAASDQLGIRIRRALGSRTAASFGVDGAGSFEGRWRGTVTVPVYEGHATARDVVYLGVPWGTLDWKGRASESEIESEELNLRKGGSELALAGRMTPGEYGHDDAVDVRVDLVKWSAEDLVRALDWPTDWTGPISGHAEIRGRRSTPLGTFVIDGEAGRYQRVGYESLHVEGRLEGDRSEVTSGEVGLGGGRARFSGTLTSDGVYDGTLTASEIDLGALLPPVRTDVEWGGRVSGTVALQGTLEKPTLHAALQSSRLFLGDEGLGAAVLTAEGRGDGQVTIEGRLAAPRTDVTLKGHIGAEPPYVSEVVAEARNTSFDPLLRVFVTSDSALWPGLVGSGTVSLQGPLARPLELVAETSFPDFTVGFPEYPVRGMGPLRLELSQGRLKLQELRFAGEGTNLVAGGQLALLENGRWDLEVQGAADLRSLAAITHRLRARGAARLNLVVSGTRDEPHMDGRLELQGAGVRIRDFPHGLEDVHGAVQFTEQAAQFQGLVGQLGGGDVSVEGQATYGKRGLLSVDLTLSGHDIALRYPEGLRSLSDLELRVFGDGVWQWVTGNINVRQALWTQRYDVTSELLAAEHSIEPSVPLREGLRFDVKIVAPGTLKMDNNLGALEARADLRLQGTSDNPVVLGHAEIDHGRMYFQGNTYVIRRGRVEFANPERLDPFFDIEAETRLRSYRVNLKMNGTLERVYPTLSSDPPLSAVQILSLLAGAEESDVVRLGQAQTDQTRLAAAGAASLAAGRLAEEMGLEREAERLFGLNRFSIDPSVLKGGVTNPTARLTVGKRLTPDLNVLYSVDLRGSGERLLSVEYMLPGKLADRVSVLLTLAEPGGLGFDVRVHHSR